MPEMTRQFNEQSVKDRMESRAGIQYQSSQLANYFGVATPLMTLVLSKLTADKVIRRVRCSGNPTMYYVPTVEQLDKEAAL